MGKGRWWLPAAVFAAAVINTDGKGIEAVFGSYLGYVFVPGLIPVSYTHLDVYKRQVAGMIAAVWIVACLM